MRVPRVLEFPVLITVTAVLTFTGVSGLQAAINMPQAHRMQAQAAEAEAQQGLEAATENELAVAEQDAILEYLVPAKAGQAPPSQTTPAQSLALTGKPTEKPANPGKPAPADGTKDTAGGAEPVTASVQAAAATPAQSPGAADAAAPKQHAEPRMHSNAQAPQARAQTTPPGTQSRPSQVTAVAAPDAARAGVSKGRKPRPAAPAPIPVSGMDYVWDQVVGSGKFPKPGKNPRTHGNGAVGGQSFGDADMTPPGHHKKFVDAGDEEPPVVFAGEVDDEQLLEHTEQLA